MSKIMSEEINEDFRRWWHHEGSGITYSLYDDQEEHTKRVAEAAWNAAMFKAVEKLLKAKINE